MTSQTCAQRIVGLIFGQPASNVVKKYTIGELITQNKSPIFPCPYSRASSSQVQLHLDTRFLGNSNSPLIRTKSDSLGFTSYIYCKFNFENPKPRSQQCFVAPFLCISPVIPVTASDFILCLSEIQSPNALRASIFSSCAVPYYYFPVRRKAQIMRHDVKLTNSMLIGLSREQNMHNIWDNNLFVGFRNCCRRVYSRFMTQINRTFPNFGPLSSSDILVLLKMLKQ